MATADSDETEQADVTQNGDETVVEGPNAASDETEYPDGTGREVEEGHQNAVHSGSKQEASFTIGTGTREQATIKVRGMGANAGEASADFDAALQHIEDNDIPERVAELVQRGNKAFEEDDE